MEVFGKPLPEEPRAALQALADLGLIPQPVYRFTTFKGGRTKVRVFLPGNVNDGIHGYADKPNREHAEKKAAGILLKAVIRRLGLCPTPDREAYPTQGEAHEAVKAWLANPKGHPKRSVFKCTCGAWHTSGKKDWRRKPQPKPVLCPGCGEPVPEENEETGEGPVVWKVTGQQCCSTECVVFLHREWLQKQGEDT